MSESSKGVSPKNNTVNMRNANKGTSGVNKQYAQVQGNRGAQLNPNNKAKYAIRGFFLELQ